MIWKRVSPQNPCPICGKGDWCQFGDRAIKCMRVESVHFCNGGGWYHFYNDLPGMVKTAAALIKGKYEPSRPAINDPAGMMRRWKEQTRFFQYESLASSLGVLAASLVGLDAAWAPEHNAWAFPMKDSHHQVTGIRLRSMRGEKWAVTGSRQGLFIPTGSVPIQQPIYLPEGPTSTAALLSLELFAIGRPSCTGSADHLNKFFKRFGIHRAVICSENDELKGPEGREKRAGIAGAKQLQQQLGIKSCIWMPPMPCKDARSFLQAGGTKAVIESEIKSKTWK